MAVPKKKTTSSKRDMRRAHDALKPNAATVCKNCGEARKPHTICSKCGFYDGKKVA